MKINSLKKKNGKIFKLNILTGKHTPGKNQLKERKNIDDLNNTISKLL